MASIMRILERVLFIVLLKDMVQNKQTERQQQQQQKQKQQQQKQNRNKLKRLLGIFLCNIM